MCIRDSGWLQAIECFFKDYDKVDQDQRTLAYEQAMERLVQKYPDDSEAAIFYALALNETAPHSDKAFSNQLKAAAILERIDREQPNHPGVTHYLIHSFDYAPLAQRGLPYADKYAQIAPAAPHAQHMPSHIYSMIGMWEPSIRSNQAALAVMKEEAARSWPGTAIPLMPPAATWPTARPWRAMWPRPARRSAASTCWSTTPPVSASATTRPRGPRGSRWT